MGAGRLPEKCTISDITDKLANPQEYVRRVFANMGECKNKHGNAVVRIGTMGDGIAPHYRIEPDRSDLDALYHWEDYFVAYHGRNHSNLGWGFGKLREHHWSEGKMTYDEVRDLLGSLRGFNRRRS